MARDWIDKQMQRWIPAHAEAVLDSFEKNLFPDIGSRPITSITAPELLASLRKVEKRGPWIPRSACFSAAVACSVSVGANSV